MSPKQKKISITILAVIVGFAAQFATKMYFDSRNEELVIETQLPALVEDLNKNLPQKVDNETVWESTTISGKNTLNFNYKVVNYNSSDIEPTLLAEVKKGSIKNGACKHFQPFFEANIPLQFNYVGKDNVKIGNYYLKKDDCSKPIIEKV